ncbi:hypothetical protein [Gaoshiqia sediminis]|uniref:Alpha-L-rhamnosidase six-hairpin glycosidase domain-containing protein n=1 Tax=Gaoshiqia sediminis TaxID=2986998 RepID=A0AA41Y3V0_9BACT|nr:hypothetical protein [Gaoshiqia sediminis]MCW0481335.1 hypothetical protein [Gaoshiqia sediminis]
MSKLICLLSMFLYVFLGLTAQVPPVLAELPANSVQKDELTRYYLSPQRVVWQSAESEEKIRNLGVLLNPGTGQAAFGLKKEAFATLTNAAGDTTGFILDFGKEIQGGIQITTCTSNRVTHRVRVRLGESVAETCSKVVGDGTTGLAGGATNHHAMRDFVTELPGYGTKEFGESGFRFVRIDLLDHETSLNLLEVRAYAAFRDVPYLGSFECSDPRLNEIWKTGAYTVHVNMQEYLWDGIKRDRMVWLGDMHPEVMTISAVFGANPVVTKSLDFVRDQTPLPRWMNGISAYSMWWVNNQYDWYLYHGNLDYLREQQTYLSGLLDLFLTKVDSLGRENLHGEGMRFLDWPSSTNEQGVHAGLQALMVMAFTRGAELYRVLGDLSRADACEKMVDKMKSYLPDANHSKQAAALLALANLMPAEKANAEVIAVDGPKNFSTFYGYYMLQAQAKAGDHQTAMDNIRTFWGAMLDLGATTFWEDFNLDWIENAARIDEMVPEGKVDIHAAYGDYCYIGYRHSLCHGWASGPTAWLSEHVLGIHVLEPGCRTVRIESHLADLQWAKGTFPTPFGLITVRHTKLPDGSIKTEWDAPKEINIIQ